MNTDTILKHLLVCALLTTGCDLLDDIRDSSSDDDDASDTGDNDDDDDDDDDSGEAEGGEEGGGEAGGSEADESGEGGAAESEGEAEGGEESAGGSGESQETGAGETGGAPCEEGTTMCLDEATVAVCVDGEPVALDCNDACLEIGGTPGLGCFFDEEAGADLCFCEEGGGGSGGA